MDNGLWIKIYVSVFTHEKTLHMAELLGTQPLYAASHMISLWTWAMSNRQEGSLDGLTAKQIALAAQYQGDEKKFIQALLTSKYLDEDYAIHNWTTYAGKFLEVKKSHADYMKAWRLLSPQERARRNHTKIRSSKTATPEQKKKTALEFFELRNGAPKVNGKHK